MDVKRDKSVKRKMTMRENEKGERGKQLVRGKPVKEKIVRGKRGGMRGNQESEKGMEMEMDQRSEGRKKRTKRGMGIDQGACQEKEIDQETRDREMLEEAKDQVTEGG